MSDFATIFHIVMASPWPPPDDPAVQTQNMGNTSGSNALPTEWLRSSQRNTMEEIRVMAQKTEFALKAFNAANFRELCREY